MRFLIARMLSALRIAHLARLFVARRRRYALMFHTIVRQRSPELVARSQTGLTVAELEQIIGWIKLRFDLLTPERFLKSSDPGVLLTFDDGMANHYTNALPVLERHSAPAIFFVSTQHVLDPRDWLPYTCRKARAQWTDKTAVPGDRAQELYDGMSIEQVAACADHPLITVGSHTISHPSLVLCDAAAIREEVVGSRRQLRDITGQDVDLFAYPNGDYDRRVVEATRKAGYRAAFAIVPKRVGTPFYEIPRLGIERPDSFYLDVKLSGLLRRSFDLPANLRGSQEGSSGTAGAQRFTSPLRGETGDVI